jgi:hypothetical protein
MFRTAACGRRDGMETRVFHNDILLNEILFPVRAGI